MEIKIHESTTKIRTFKTERGYKIITESKFNESLNVIE